MQKINTNHGYTMVLFLAFIVAILLAGFSLYDNGTVAAERIRMQNTADATAYSTMTVLTRDMNFIAYTNRAMVANQVAIAQMVGLNSWMHMIDQSAKNLDTLAKFSYAFPPVGIWLNRATNLLSRATNAGVQGMNAFTKAGIIGSDKIIAALSKVQLFFQGATFDMAIQTYDKVSLANDKDIEKGFLGSAFAFSKLIKSWTNELEQNNTASTLRDKKSKRQLKRYNEFADIVKKSRDPFSANRSHDWIDEWTTILNLGTFKLNMAIIKKGGSDFISKKINGRNLQWEWSAMDTVSFWGQYKWLTLLHGWKTDEIELVPMGWGAAHALYSKNISNNYFNYARYKNKKYWGNAWRNNMAAYIATKDNGNNNIVNTQGLRPFYDLKLNEYKNTGPSIVALLTKPRNKLRLQQTLDEQDSKYNRSINMKIEQKGSIANNVIYGLSKAETYFSRPHDLWPRPDQYREYGNLYNPFWQTRLLENNVKEKNTAALIQAIN